MGESLNQNESCVQPSSTFPLKPIQMESSSSKTRPSGISSCFQMLIIIPETSTQACWMLSEQTRDKKNSIKSKGGLHTEVWQRMQEFQTMTNESVISDGASTILETPWMDACITNTSGDFTEGAPTTDRLQKLRAEDAEWWKDKDVHTLSAAGAGAMFSAQRAKHLMTTC